MRIQIFYIRALIVAECHDPLRTHRQAVGRIKFASGGTQGCARRGGCAPVCTVDLTFSVIRCARAVSYGSHPAKICAVACTS